MDIRNLMINDWVHIAPTVKGRPEYDTQVYGIGPEVILVKRDSGANSIELDRVNAIPLTAEILEKNFDRSDYDEDNEEDIYLQCDYNYNREIHFIYDHSDGRTIVITGLSAIAVTYVHQLQQLLRILPYRTIADNFKID